MRSRKPKHKRELVELGKEIKALKKQVTAAEKVLQQERSRSEDKSRHINSMLSQRIELDKELENMKEIRDRNFKWFRIEEERRIVLENKLTEAKNNIKLMTISFYLLSILIIIINLTR